MKALIEEFNEKLRALLEELRGKKTELEASLREVQSKIDVKIDEARRYKVEVDYSKAEINRLEGEIKSLEDDLADLTSRFSNKDLEAILETGNKEINAQIMNRQREIDKQRERINEFTEKARTIKDLLINLKRDKENKKNKLANIDGVYRYYLEELNRIMNHASENPDSLETNEEPTDESYVDENEIEVDDKPIFDEIASIDSDTHENSEVVEETETKEEPVMEEETFVEPVIVPTEDIPETEIPEVHIDETPLDVNSYNEDEVEENHVHEEDLYKDESDITKLFATDSKDSFDSFDIKSLSDSIDREYENIFGDSTEIALTDDDDKFKLPENMNQNIFDEPKVEEQNELVDLNVNEDTSNTGEFNFFGDTEPVEEIIPEVPKQEVHEEVHQVETPAEDNTELINFFSSNNLDFNKFSKDEQEKLRNNFNLINYTKTLDILRKNNIKLEYLYGAADVFKIIHSELENIINKLLVAGQTSANISYVLNSLPYINSFDLQDVIDSYGPQIKDANIADLIVKAKHLRELGGGA